MRIEVFEPGKSIKDNVVVRLAVKINAMDDKSAVLVMVDEFGKEVSLPCIAHFKVIDEKLQMHLAGCVNPEFVRVEGSNGTIKLY